jgi:hypothetical protein
MKFFLISIFGICLWLSLAQASTDSKMKLVGYVRSFDTQNIVVESGNQRFTVPRSFYPDKTRSGDLISIPVTKAEFVAFKHATAAKK